jgi:hypothetical protein
MYNLFVHGLPTYPISISKKDKKIGLSVRIVFQKAMISSWIELRLKK